MIKLLLQTTIVDTPDDWNISRFSALARYLSGVKDANGQLAFNVTARNRESQRADDPVLSSLPGLGFDQLWLFAVDTGDGLTPSDCEAITEFRRQGGGLFVTRDHMDLGSSICTLGGIGAAHHFHTKNLDPRESNRARDDTFNLDISWPNYHSGANGDYQEVQAVGPVHPAIADPSSPTGALRYLPSHPHEGSVSAPEGDASARVILEGLSKTSGAAFNIAVAFERSKEGGRAIAHSTFHHFADFNWDPANGSPSFVTEVSGDGIVRNPAALESTHRYVSNVGFWLGSRGGE